MLDEATVAHLIRVARLVPVPVSKPVPVPGDRKHLSILDRP